MLPIATVQLYIVNALRDDSSEDDTWRFALDNDGDSYYDQNGW